MFDPHLQSEIEMKHKPSDRLRSGQKLYQNCTKYDVTRLFSTDRDQDNATQ